MYTMRETCEKTGLSYETLKFYCNEAIDYIDWKQGFYDDVLSGKIEYYSNLIDTSK